jgi:hypothetical protein
MWRKGEEGNSARRVVPKKFREQVVKLCHDPPLAGHQGIERTVEKVKSRYYWRGISKYVSAYVNGCMDCDQNKKTTVSARHPMLCYHAGSPMERVHLDFSGPLPRTEKGNEHILIMVDQFTRWVECISLPSQSAEKTGRDAMNQFFSRFGCPFQVFTDQWRNFKSTLLRAMCDLLHIHKSRTTPYHPSANGEVERCNRTLMAAVRCFIGKNQRSWDQYLPQLAGESRASVNRSTGYTPNMMMLGREIGLPVQLLLRSPGKTRQPEGDQYVGELQTAIDG